MTDPVDRAAVREMVLTEIETALRQFDGVPHWGTERLPGDGISLVVRHSDALHVLLHLRQRIRALPSPPAPATAEKETL
jgi:hypothetical protein